MTPAPELIAEYQKLVIAYGNACARYGRSTRVEVEPESHHAECLERAVDCVNACRGFDPRKMRLKVLAWNLRKCVLRVWDGGATIKNKNLEYHALGNTEEAICRAAVAAGVLTEEDLK